MYYDGPSYMGVIGFFFCIVQPIGSQASMSYNTISTKPAILRVASI